VLSTTAQQVLPTCGWEKGALLGHGWRAFHLETAAKLLISLEAIFAIVSKCTLKSLDNQTDFDSAIRRFDPSRPSQAVAQL
jgi:hypothetical protein